jgi:hypothetical protein
VIFLQSPNRAHRDTVSPGLPTCSSFLALFARVSNRARKTRLKEKKKINRTPFVAQAHIRHLYISPAAPRPRLRARVSYSCIEYISCSLTRVRYQTPSHACRPARRCSTECKRRPLTRKTLHPRPHGKTSSSFPPPVHGTSRTDRLGRGIGRLGRAKSRSVRRQGRPSRRFNNDTQLDFALDHSLAARNFSRGGPQHMWRPKNVHGTF